MNYRVFIKYWVFSDITGSLSAGRIGTKIATLLGRNTILYVPCSKKDEKIFTFLITLRRLNIIPWIFKSELLFTKLRGALRLNMIKS